jgi:tetratricopeptide (TPR) repeat protein
VRLAREAAERAVELDPRDAEAHAVYAMSFGDRGDFERAKREFDTALRLGPSQFEILTFYISWASTMGDPHRGAEMVDRAIELNPDFPMWSARTFAYAYFMVGRYADALLMFEHFSPENYGQWMWAIRAGSLAALGRDEDARIAVEEALRMFPDFTIEEFAGAPGWSESERSRFNETMRLAGYPACAKPEARAKILERLRLEGCGS